MTTENTTTIIKYQPKAAKTKKKKSKKSKRGNRPQNMALTRAPRRIPQHMVQQVCSLTDPFCVHAMGGKYPLSTSGRTITETVRAIWSPVNSASGAGALVFMPNPLFPANQPTLATGTYTLANTNNASPVTSMFATYGKEFKLTTWGVRVITIASATNASGYMNIGIMDDVQVGQTFSAGTTNYKEWRAVPLRHGLEMTVISKPISVEARQFSPAPTNNSWPVGAWESIVFEWTGNVASGNGIVFETFYNYEYSLANPSSAVASMASMAPPPNPVIQRATDSVYRSVGNIFNMGVDAFGSFITKKAAQALGGYLGGPAGASAAGMIMDVT